MDLRMRQVAEQGVPAQDIIGRMTGHLLDLQKIWTTTAVQLASQAVAAVADLKSSRSS